MPAVILKMQHVSRGVGRQMGKELGQARKQTMRDTAAFWHQQIFPRHFGNGNKTQYGLQQRNRKYVEEIKPREGNGPGRFTYEVLKGQSLFWAKNMVKITGTANRVTVKATTPAYFTRPFIGSFIGPNGKMKTITQQPNKPEEVTRHNQRDRDDINNFARGRLQELIARSLVRSVTTQIG
jgi:hypothetical protein